VKVRLQEQPFKVLSLLVSRAGELVTREELRRALWSDAVFVDFDQGLNKAVAKIRRALGDLANHSHYVETLERHGYRFIAPVEDIVPGGHASRPGTQLAAHRLVWGECSIALHEGSHVIGREPKAPICIESSVVSRRHASVVVARSHVTIVDHGSTNGTFVNGQRIEEATALVDGDEIRIGPARLMFRSDSSCASTIPDPPGAKPGVPPRS
jgi:DNA-binding winged helix-turn-helix (wHTH) protein